MIETSTSLLELGGPVVLILLAISVAALAVILAKVFQFSSARVGRHTQVRQAVAQWRTGEREKAAQNLLKDRSLSAALVRGAMDAIQLLDQQVLTSQERDIREERLREEISARAADRLFGLTSWLKALDLVTQIAPLLGLLGTVLGMIETFRPSRIPGHRQIRRLSRRHLGRLADHGMRPCRGHSRVGRGDLVRNSAGEGTGRP